ncbi:MAG: hypothetical protein HKP58_20290 [Desulfatitalea sp.]|nr:hypothetical protein [Desulfatitalea sp.]NNK02758.1 hypothetical protein [Desulfatitalea sp.]
MATVNYSVPDEVKKTFNAVFAGRNKSAIITELMLRGIEEEKDRQRSAKAIDRLLARRKTKRPVDSSRIRAAREDLRS